jgi:hypothetical protein
MHPLLFSFLQDKKILLLLLGSRIIYRLQISSSKFFQRMFRNKLHLPHCPAKGTARMHLSPMFFAHLCRQTRNLGLGTESVSTTRFIRDHPIPQFTIRNRIIGIQQHAALIRAWHKGKVRRRRRRNSHLFVFSELNNDATGIY